LQSVENTIADTEYDIADTYTASQGTTNTSSSSSGSSGGGGGSGGGDSGPTLEEI
jgi:uncharacterized membrane protein